jgi:hypothetical protein
VSDRADRDRDRPGGGSDADLEELGDDVIIAQETGAHAPQRRVNVTTDHPSIVISEHPPAHPSNRAPTYRTRRERTEQTVVIRDRKKLEQMRREMTRQYRKKKGVERRTIYLIAVAALASLALGTLIAALVDSTTAAAPATVRALPQPEPAMGEPAPSAVPPGTIDLDALPEPGKGARRNDAP